MSGGPMTATMTVCCCCCCCCEAVAATLSALETLVVDIVALAEAGDGAGATGAGDVTALNPNEFAAALVDVKVDVDDVAALS